MSTATSTPTPPAPRRRRPAVTRHDVLVAALGLIDRDGLEDLSLRKLAGELDVETMSLYKRVANKDDLLAGVAELIWSEVAADAPPTEDWAEWLRALGHAYRAAVHHHPNAVPVLFGIEVFPVPLLDVMATQLERASDGWPPRSQAVAAVCAVSAFAIGTAVTERCLQCAVHTAGTDDPTTLERHRLRRIMRALPDDAPDRIVDTAMAVCGCDADAMFTNGLDLIIRGCTTPTH